MCVAAHRNAQSARACRPVYFAGPRMPVLPAPLPTPRSRPDPKLPILPPAPAAAPVPPALLSAPDRPAAAPPALASPVGPAPAEPDVGGAAPCAAADPTPIARVSATARDNNRVDRCVMVASVAPHGADFARFVRLLALAADRRRSGRVNAEARREKRRGDRLVRLRFRCSGGGPARRREPRPPGSGPRPAERAPEWLNQAAGPQSP